MEAGGSTPIPKPENVKEWFKLGLNRLKTKDFVGSVRAFEQGLKFNPDDEDAWRLLGITHFRLEDYKGAVRAFEQAIKRNSGDEDAWRLLGMTRFRLEDYTGAINAYEQVLEFNPKLGLAWKELGMARENIGNFAGAVEAYEAALELNPDDEEIRVSFERARNIEGQGGVKDEEKEEQVKVEEVTVESGKVNIRRQYEFIGGKIRVKVKITNPGKNGLLRVRFTLDVPESMHLLHTEPAAYIREGATMKINDFLPGEEKAVARFLNH